MKSNLILHCGASKVERETLQAVPTPQATASWQPVSHFELLGQVERALSSRKLSIVAQAHGLTRDGARYFGLLQVSNDKIESEEKDYGYCLGIRNAHDKRFPCGLAVGSSVFICDNLAFSAEITVARRHTTHVKRDLPQLMARAVGKLSRKWADQDKRFDAYKEHELSDVQAHDLLIRALDCRAVTSPSFPILNEWRHPVTGS
jgi:hypothetical protein